MGTVKRERQKRNKLLGQPFRIVVCASPAPTIEPILPLVKAALLYGDEVVLHSPLAATLAGIGAAVNGDQMGLLRFVFDVGPALHPQIAEQVASLDRDNGPGSGRQIIEIMANPLTQHLLKRMNVPAEQLAVLTEFREQQMPRIQQQLIEVADKQLSDAGFDQLSSAFRADLLRVDGFDVTVTDFEGAYMDELQRLLTDKSIYPVFDESMGSLVRSAIAEGRIDPGRFGPTRSANASLSERFLAQLPTFPAASVDEVVGIRDDLRGPLARFRSELTTIVTDLSTNAWDEDFGDFAQQAWVQRAAPAIREIEELAQERKLLVTYGPEAIGATGAIAGLYAGVSTGSLTAGIGMAATGGVAALAGQRKRQSVNKVIRANPYFFLYDTNDRLSG